MQDKITHIKVNEIEYPLVLNLNVIEKIQEEYETFEKWGEMTEGKENEVNVKALKFGVTEMINEGIDIENEKKETKRDFVTEKQVGRIITDLGIQKMAEKVQNTIIDSTKIEDDTKNV